MEPFVYKPSLFWALKVERLAHENEPIYDLHGVEDWQKVVRAIRLELADAIEHRSQSFLDARQELGPDEDFNWTLKSAVLRSLAQDIREME